MDLGIAFRLDSNGAGYDSAFYDKLTRGAKDYVQAGLQALDFYSCFLDTANDAYQCWGPVPNQAAYDKMDRTAPEGYIHPMTCTEMTTLAVFISQILAGGQGARKVEARKDKDEVGAEMLNELLQWNDDQQPTYYQIFLWVIDALVSNRGVMYDHWKEIYQISLESVEEEVPGQWMEPEEKPKTFTRYKKKRKVIGGFNKIELINPIDFISDPMLPNHLFQEGRFAGHRVLIPWIELERRSQLPVGNYEYVLPAVVKKLKNRPTASGAWTTNNASGTTVGSIRSRSYFERQRRGNPVGFANATGQVNKEDGGIVECFLLTIRAAPKSYDIYEDDEAELIEFLIAPDSNLLSVNIKEQVHDQYCYSVGEGRPGAHYQFNPSWTLVIRPIQAYVDFLKKKHMQVLAKTTGNMFLIDERYVNVEELTDPDKDGQIITRTELGRDKPSDYVVTQIPVNDTTKSFNEEMLLWIKQAENTTGAHAAMQGKEQEGDPTATEYVGNQQMSSGRVSTMARCLSEIALMPQTRRFVSNFQQFAPDEMTIRITGDASGDYDPDKSKEKYLKIRRDSKDFPEGDPRRMLPDIQGEFDVVPADLAMPGTDARKVAALSRVIEASDNPSLAQYFDSTVPGNLDLKKILYEASKASGMRVSNFIISRDQALKNLQSKQLATGGGVTPPPPGSPTAPPGTPPAAPPVPVAPGLTQPSPELPPTESAAPPQPSPSNV